MASARASCDRCGNNDVLLSVNAITVAVCLEGATTYSFHCPACGELNVKAASGWAVDVLLAGGCRFVACDRPVELGEAHVGPPISLDDLLAFHEALDGDWAGALRRESAA